jgi:hypothetical protein
MYSLSSRVGVLIASKSSIMNAPPRPDPSPRD